MMQCQPSTSTSTSCELFVFFFIIIACLQFLYIAVSTPPFSLSSPHPTALARGEQLILGFERLPNAIRRDSAVRSGRPIRRREPSALGRKVSTMSKAETAPADGRPTGDETDKGQSHTPRAHPTPTSTRTNPTSGSVPCHRGLARAGIQIAPAGGPLTADRRLKAPKSGS